MAYLMAKSDAKALSSTGSVIFNILYPVFNIGLIALEWHMLPGVIDWIENAPHGKLEEAVGNDEEEAEEEAEAGQLHTEW